MCSPSSVTASRRSGGSKVRALGATTVIRSNRWAHLYNTEKLHEYLDYVPPAEFEAAFYAAHTADHEVVGVQ
ncbi:MAG: hypothetical protein ACRDY3_09735 [Acidimicrobiales bacterium]